MLGSSELDCMQGIGYGDLTSNVFSELQRQQNIEANRALLQKLDLDQGANSLGFVAVATSSKPPKAPKAKAQPR
ncbi:hypothetical protein FRC17_007203, partial [Serendipita sp. 399]